MAANKGVGANRMAATPTGIRVAAKAPSPMGSAALSSPISAYWPGRVRRDGRLPRNPENTSIATAAIVIRAPVMNPALTSTDATRTRSAVDPQSAANPRINSKSPKLIAERLYRRTLWKANRSSFLRGG